MLPFITEQIYQGLVADQQPEAPVSVHLCDFPVADESRIDGELERSMEAVRLAVRLGHNLRKQSELKVRQPLASATIVTHSPEANRAIAEHADLIAEELNVKEIVASTDEAALVSLSVKANFKALGPRLGSNMKAMAAKISSLAAADISTLVDGGVVVIDGVTLTSDDVLIDRQALHGLLVATEGSVSVALDPAIDADLRHEGIARDIVSTIQRIRRTHQLDVTDRVIVSWETSDPDLAVSIVTFEKLIAAEVLATTISREPSLTTTNEPVDLDGRQLYLTVTVA